MIDRFGGISTCKNLKFSLEIPPYAVNHEVQLEISNLSVENAPTIPCDYGEFILSDIVLIRPTGMRFRIPANVN